MMAAAVPSGNYQQAMAPVVHVDDSMTVLQWLGWAIKFLILAIIIGLLCVVVWSLVKWAFSGKKNEDSLYGEDDNFMFETPDLIAIFFGVQQAAMDGDKAMMSRFASGEFGATLCDSPEPGRVARATLKEINYDIDYFTSGPVVRYKFRDLVAGSEVVEKWVFNHDWMLVGIQPVSAT